MKKSIFVISMILICLILTTSPAFAATYYVSKSGSDSKACTGKGTNACATVNGAIAKAGSGDAIKIESGSYNIANESGSRVQVTKSNLTITAYDPGNPPIIINNGASDPWQGAIEVRNPVTLSYLIVDCNNRSATWGPIGIRLWQGSEGSVLDNIITRNAFSGVIIDAGKNITITNSTSYNHGTTGTGAASGSGFGFATSGDSTSTNWNEKILLQNCTAYNCGGDGFQVQRHSGGTGFDRSYIEIDNCNFYNNDEDGIDMKEVSYIRIHDSLMHDNNGDGVISHSGKDQGKNVEVYNNIIYNNGWWGIFTGSGGNWTIQNNLVYNNANGRKWDSYQTAGIHTSGAGNLIYHNTLYNNGTAPGSKSYAGYRGSGTFQDNILFMNGSIHGNIKSDSTGIISYNYVYPTSPGITGTSAITVSNPMLVDPGNGNFTLLSGSPLIDAGMDAGVATDFDGNLRPAGSGYDIGAYEYNGQPGGSTFPAAPTGLRVVQN